MEKKFYVSCPMDCPDLCRYIVTVKNNKIIDLIGDKAHPTTRGFVCHKGKALVKRLYHPDRIKSPLVKKGNKFVGASYNEVIDLISYKLIDIEKKFGKKAIINYSSDGYGGIRNRIQSIFFNCFGGVTEPEGSLCLGAGIAAQTYDFGSAKGHFPHDVLNAEIIIVWGRNPKFTSIHLYSFLKKAERKGARVIVIDPIKTATAKAFDTYIRIKPSTDAALALAMANVIIKENLIDKSFIKNHVVGFNRFKSYASDFSLEIAQNITGIDANIIKDLALSYAVSDHASIYIGFGMQRYHNGGNSIRCIDALAAICGKIGKKGCGANYTVQSMSPYLSEIYNESKNYVTTKLRFPYGKLGDFLSSQPESFFKAIFVSGGNPLVQSPDLKKTIEQFSKIEFKVVFEQFMTDTAKQADVVIPAAFSFEQSDLFTTSMYSPVLNYSQKAIDPPEGVISELDFYLKLADKLEMDNLGFNNVEEYLQLSAKPLLEKFNLAFDLLPHQYLSLEEEVAWQDKNFNTPSGKIEIYSEQAKTDGLSPLPEYIEPLKATKDLPLRFLSCHTESSLHSQGFLGNEERPIVHLNKNTAQMLGVDNDESVFVKGSKTGIQARVFVDEAIHENTAFIYQGYWHKSGAVNFLTDSVISDMGKQAAFYDSFCTIQKLS